MKYDFAGWATKFNVKCSDGRTIKDEAFRHCDGMTVPIVWNHNHKDPLNVLGHGTLEYVPNQGMYVYGSFNDTMSGNESRKLLEHGDINSLSIYANNLREIGKDVIHGNIREVSLVLGGANPEARIESIISHSDEDSEAAIIYFKDGLELFHSDEDSQNDDYEEEDESDMAREDYEDYEDYEDDELDDDATIEEVLDTFTDQQKLAMYAVLGSVLEDLADEEDAGGEDMKHNLFDMDEEYVEEGVLTHSDEMAVLELAKKSNCGNFRDAMMAYIENDEALSHAFHNDDDEESLEFLFPEWHDITKPWNTEIKRDYSWVERVMNGVSKSPMSRLRTKQFDLTDPQLRALGYVKATEKVRQGVIKMLKRTTDPQTVYVKEQLERDDIIDITDFDVVQYQWGVMRDLLKEEIARAILIGDGRTDVDPHKIKEDHIRSILNDDELYVIHREVDFAAKKQELQGTDTNKRFGENFIKAEAMIEAILYAREKYKGSGHLVLFCTPHLVNVMLLARDLNGRRIYDSISDLKAALNVSDIVTVEQFEGIKRVNPSTNGTRDLLGIFVDLNDYKVGATRGGEITKFDDFNIDFNQYKYLIETRLSGALTKVKSAIVLEEKEVSASQSSGM